MSLKSIKPLRSLAHKGMPGPLPLPLPSSIVVFLVTKVQNFMFLPIELDLVRLGPSLQLVQTFSNPDPIIQCVSSSLSALCQCKFDN